MSARLPIPDAAVRATIQGRVERIAESLMRLGQAVDALRSSSCAALGDMEQQLHAAFRQVRQLRSRLAGEDEGTP